MIANMPQPIAKPMGDTFDHFLIIIGAGMSPLAPLPHSVVRWGGVVAVAVLLPALGLIGACCIGVGITGVCGAGVGELVRSDMNSVESG